MGGRPIILVVDDDAETRLRLADHLRRRYEPDYGVVGVTSAEAYDVLASGALVPLAAVLAPSDLEDGTSAVAMMAEVHRADPATRRVTLVPRGEWRHTRFGVR